METHGSAVKSALEMPEILEMILTSVPPHDILLLQRTSRLWNSLICTSPRLQKALFMRPDWQLEVKCIDPRRPLNKPGERPKNNTLLRPVLGGIYPTMTLKMVSPSTTDYLVNDVAELDPSVAPKQPARDKEQEPGHWGWDVSVSFPADRLPTSPGSKPAVHYKNASWRKMYLSQPPATSLHLCRRWQRAANPAIQCESGITMGAFVDRATKASELWNELFIGSDRDWHFEGGIKFSRFEAVDREIAV